LERIAISGQRIERQRRRRRILRFILCLIAWPLIAWLAARSLIVQVEVPRADVIVVLSGSSAYLERTRLAAELFKERRAPKILLTNDGQPSGWSSAEQRNPLFVERAVVELQKAGVPRDKIEVLSETVASTHDEVMLLRAVAGQRNLHAIIFVTSAYHSRRAQWTLKRAFQGSDVQIGLSAVPPGEQTPNPATWWLSVRGWKMVAAEYFKLIYYRVMYR
jgi:uncharacterized SAM-binding protein YcdF (DUF218 family)